MNSVLYIVLSVFLSFGAVIFIFFRKRKRELIAHQIEAEKLISRIFSEQAYCPVVKANYIYGVPTYQLNFLRNEDKQDAMSNGLTQLFIEGIQKLHEDWPMENEGYDASLSVSITSTDD